jgi:hypothetical protein
MGMAGGPPNQYVALLFAGFSQKVIWLRFRCWLYIRYWVLINTICVFRRFQYTSEDLSLNEKAWR